MEQLKSTHLQAGKYMVRGDFLIENNWKFMRCKNFIRALKLGKVPRSHFECLKVLAAHKKISLEELVVMRPLTYEKNEYLPYNRIAVSKYIFYLGSAIKREYEY